MCDVRALLCQRKKGLRVRVGAVRRRRTLCAPRAWCPARRWLLCLAVVGLSSALSALPLTHHSSPGGGRRGKGHALWPLPLAPIWPRTRARAGSAQAHGPSRLPPAAAGRRPFSPPFLSAPGPSVLEAVGPAHALCGEFLNSHGWWCPPHPPRVAARLPWGRPRAARG